MQASRVVKIRTRGAAGAVESTAAAAGSDPAQDREQIEVLVARLRRHPGRFAGPAALAREAELAIPALDRLVRHLYHTTPSRLLLDARLARARRQLIEEDVPLSSLSDDLGFESLARFKGDFRAATGLSPLAYRRLRGARSLAFDLPRDYPTQRILRYLGREHDSLTVRVEGRDFATAVRLAGRPRILRVALRSGDARLELDTPARGSKALRAGDAAEALAIVRRLLGLARSSDEFELQVGSVPELAPLLEGRRGLRIPLVADPFDGLIWVIVGQQISLPFAYALRRALIEMLGEPAGSGLSTPPTPEAVAGLDLERLTAERYSRRKAEYLVGVAQQIAAGELRLDRLALASAPAVEERLLAVRGLGPWSVQYLLMRVFGFEDCLPVGDAGLARALERFFALGEPTGGRRMQELMAPFAPYRSWATFYLWQSLEKLEKKP
jgi:AraC family transcriptional regulator of adaptative response / DNA-3-methyladenine glycosylase II